MGIRVEKLTEEQIREWGLESWPIWTKEVSRFDWRYDEPERCYFLEGDVVVETDEGDVHMGQGDFVTFPRGLSCVWNVKVPVKKHYSFG